MTVEEMCKALGISRRRLSQLQREGLPFERRNRTLTFDPVAVAEWAASGGRSKIVYQLGVAAQKISNQNGDAQPAAAPAADQSTDNPENTVMSMESALADLSEKLRREAKAVENASDAMRPYVMEGYVKIFREKLLAEKAIHKIKLEAASSVPLEVVEADYAERAQTAKARLLALPASVAGRLAGRTESEINDLLSAEIRDICNAIADQYRPQT
jgi:hypothetical protein